MFDTNFEITIPEYIGIELERCKLEHLWYKKTAFLWNMISELPVRSL